MHAPAPGFCVKTPVLGSRSNSKMVLLPELTTYRLRPLGVIASPVGALSASARQVALAVERKHPTSPAFCTSCPLAGLRSNVSSAFEPVTYALAPSGEITMLCASGR